VIESKDDAHEGNLSFRSAIHIVFIERALSEETIFHYLGYEKDQTLSLRQDIRSNELDDLLEAVLTLEKSERLCSHFNPVRSFFLPPRSNILHIFGIRVQPVDRWIMPGIGKFGIEGPETSYESARVLGDRLGEITTWRAHRTHYAYRCPIASQGCNGPAALIKLCQSCRQ